jgi:hypothetical protein
VSSAFASRSLAGVQHRSSRAFVAATARASNRPQKPGVGGKTLEEASRMAAEALTLHIQGMVEDGETVPESFAARIWLNDPRPKESQPPISVQSAAWASPRFDIFAWPNISPEPSMASAEL